MKKKTEFITVCPNCGSKNVGPDLSKDMLAWSGSTRMLCKDCNYSSIVFPEITEPELKKFKQQIKKRTPEQQEELSKLSRTKGYTWPLLNKLVLLGYLFVLIGWIVILIAGTAFDLNVEPIIGIVGLVLLILTIIVVIYAIVKRRIN